MTKYYTNYEDQLRRLDEVFCPENRAEGPVIAYVTGPPGSGRSTLCRKWVNDQGKGTFPDGTFYIALALAAERASDALEDLLRAVGYRPDEIPSGLEARSAMWRSWSYGKKIALIIDNALLPAEIAPLIPGVGPAVVLVVASGETRKLRTGYPGERVRIDPLTKEAARLLLGRMIGTDRLEAESGQIDELIGLGARLAGPLTVLGGLLEEEPAAETLRRIERKGSMLDALEFAPVFDAAYDLLSPLCQACYQVLGAHPGDGAVAVRTVAAVVGEGEFEVSDALKELTRRHLAQEVADNRYLIAGSLVRDHAATKADDELPLRIVSAYRGAGLAAEAALPNRGWMAEIWPQLAVEPSDGKAAREWLDVERENLEAVVELTYRLGKHQWVCQFCLVLWSVHLKGEHSGEMVRVNDRGIEAARAWGNDLAAAVMTFQLGFAYRQAYQAGFAVARFQESIDFASKAGSSAALATAIESLGLAKLDLGEPVEAEALFRRALELAKQIGNGRREAVACFHLAKVRPPSEALELLDAAEAILGAEHLNQVKIALWRGKKLVEDGAYADADAVLTETLALATERSFNRERAEVNEALGDSAFATDRPADARAYWESAKEIYYFYGFTPDRDRVSAKLAQ
ncbi:AAA family ATPase [Amycolatopsis sp. NPDC057786]|uniref:AAA family ATPase n=1 Tax=Amycolatopsis sp. NPDC057786 TaxID=3346250 RepID=UPI00366B3679